MRTVAAAAVAIVATVGVAGARGADDLPAKPCRSSEVRTLVARFVDAFNQGDARRLERLFAPEPYFRWYATDGPGARSLRSVSNRARLVAYFRRRHARQERLSLESLRVNGNTFASGHGWKTYGNFDFRLVRTATDVPEKPYVGKGSLHCYPSRPDQLIVWAMGRDG